MLCYSEQILLTLVLFKMTCTPVCTRSYDLRKKKEVNDSSFFLSLLPSLKKLALHRREKKQKKKKKIYNQTFLIFYEMWRAFVVGKCWTDRDDTDVVYLMYIFITLTYAISSLHLLLASISILVGIISQSRSPVWMAHSVSPIWSGIFVSISNNHVLGNKNNIWIC